LEYYRKVEVNRPDDLNIAYAIGHCLMEMGAIKDALKMFYKVEYLAPDSSKALRPVAWCNFLTGDYDKSAQYFNKILSENPVASDYLNLGHLSLATGKYNDALENYKKCISLSSSEDFQSMMAGDLKVLDSAGVDNVIREIVVDKALSSN
ncbi:MAG: tetratricopeptide repeat protein, partial [Paramuribaculum sp.]|nr:tetratricopeptide repeat protein [Paramuribaculum sp.]